MPYDEFKEVAVKAARAAGAILLEGLSSNRTIRTKSSHSDLVTEFDKRAETEIVGFIRGAFPDHQIVAEEGSGGGSGPTYCWYIDPIDGTTNFAHGYPLTCTSIGLMESGEMVMGVVFDAVHDEMFIGVKGQGASLNGKPIHVSSTDTLLRSLLATGFPYDRQLVGFNVQCWEAFLHKAQAVRRDGCAELDLCYLAMGRYDGFWEYGFATWDMAAGSVIIREAGGKVSLPTGELVLGVSRNIVASNGLIHQEILDVLAGVSQAQQPSGQR